MNLFIRMTFSLSTPSRCFLFSVLFLAHVSALEERQPLELVKIQIPHASNPTRAWGSSKKEGSGGPKLLYSITIPRIRNNVSVVCSDLVGWQYQPQLITWKDLSTPETKVAWHTNNIRYNSPVTTQKTSLDRNKRWYQTTSIHKWMVNIKYVN